MALVFYNRSYSSHKGRVRFCSITALYSFMIGLSLSYSGNSLAAVTYTYIGNSYNVFSQGYLDTNIFSSANFITGEFTFANPIAPNSAISTAPISWSMTDGSFTITSSDPPWQNPPGTNAVSILTQLNLVTDNQGAIFAWSFGAATNWYSDSNPYFSYGGIHLGSGGCVVGCLNSDASSYSLYNSSSYGGNYSPGAWSVGATTVPVPAAAWLFSSGLIGLLSFVRKRKVFGH